MKYLSYFSKNLFAHELLHFFSAILISVVVFMKFHQPALILVVFAASVLIDLDHYLEGLFFHHGKLGWVWNTFPGIYWEKTGRMTIFFHSWELLALVLFLGYLLQQWVLAVVIAFSLGVHLLLDTLVYLPSNAVYPWIYFFSYRLYHRFDYKKLCLEGRR